MTGGMDYDEFEKLTKNFQKLVNDYDKFVDDFLKTEGNKCLANTIENTPVNPINGGRLKGGWRLAGPFKRAGNIRYVIIHNPVKYAIWVEDGHRIVNQYGVDTGRWKKGVHMARIALAETELKLDSRFRTQFNKFCKDRGVGQ